MQQISKVVKSVMGLLGENHDAAPPSETSTSNLQTRSPPTQSRTCTGNSLVSHTPKSHDHRPHQPSRARRPYKRPSVNEDERRLLPDYSVPADAVILPPAELWAYDREPDMRKPKPGSNGSFKPMNTISGGSASQGFARSNLKYGATRRSPADAHLGFARQHEDGFAYGHEHPRKRRRLTHQHANDDLIEVLDDDSVSEIHPPRHYPTSCSPHSPHAAPSVTSLSHRSEDNYSGTPKYSSTGHSAFLQTDALINPRRRKPSRRPSSPDITYTGSGSRRGSAHQHAIDVDSEQDELHGSADSIVTSKHFLVPKGDERIDTSTGPGAIAHQPIPTSDFSKLRSIFRRDLGPQQIDEDMDELAGESGDTKRDAALPKTSRPRRAPPTPVRKVKAKTSAINEYQPAITVRWPLSLARTYGLETQSDDISLKPRSTDSKSFDIDCLTSLNRYETLITLDLTKLVTGQTDGRHSIRLAGSRLASGARYLFDLTFLNATDFKVFEQQLSQASIKLIPRPSDYFDKLFAKPLPPQSVTQSTEASHAVESERGGDGVPPSQPKLPMISQLNPANLEGDLREGSRKLKEAGRKVDEAPSNFAATRPIRATRNNRSYAEVNQPLAEPEPSKYSIEVGLGPRWPKPVEYGSGRLRALVNFEDLERLDEGECLNDALIEFYIIYLLEQANVPANTVYLFNTYFYPKLTQSVPGQKGIINYEGVRRWTAKEDIFRYDYLLVPVCESYHWYLAIICNVSNIARKPLLDGLDSSSPGPGPASAARSQQGNTIPGESKSGHVKPGSAAGPAAKSKVVVDLEDTDDPNLFDEEQRRQAEQQAGNKLVESDTSAPTESPLSRQSPATVETARLERLTIDDGIPKGILADAGPPSPPSARKPGKNKFLKKYNTEEPIIIILDSLGSSHPKTSKVLKDYILAEGRDKRGMEALITQNAFYPKEQHIPMQPNFTDCGVYLLAYVQKFLENPRQFVTKILTREMDIEMDWPGMNANNLRSKMREILQKTEQTQREQRRALKKKKKLQEVKQESVAGNVDAARAMEAVASKEEVPHKKDVVPETQAIPSGVISGSQPREPEAAISRQSPRLSPPLQPMQPSIPAPTRLADSAVSGIATVPGSQRRTSPQVVVEVRSPKRRADQSFHENHRSSIPSHISKKQRVKTEVGGMDSVLHEDQVTAKSNKSSEAQRRPRHNIEVSETTAYHPDNSPARARSVPRTVAPSPRPRSPARGSSAAPIEIEDSQDNIQPGPSPMRALPKTFGTEGRRPQKPTGIRRASPVKYPRPVPISSEDPRGDSHEEKVRQGVNDSPSSGDDADSSSEEDDGNDDRVVRETPPVSASFEIAG